MMVTIQAGKRALGVCLLLLLVASCSREQQDWRSAEAADTIQSYGEFIQRHPESELTTQARMRVAQLGEDRDWQHAGSVDTADAYRQFITQHPAGKWTQEARIRQDNFSLGAQGKGDVAAAGSAAGRTESGMRPGGSVGAVADESVGATADAARGSGLATPGEAAVPAGAAPAAGTVLGAGAASGSAAPTAAGSGSALGADAVAAMAAMGPRAFGIQLGAFASEAGASNQWHVLTGQFPGELRGLTERIMAAETGSGRIYRLQATVGEEDKARAICEALRKRSQDCVPVLPRLPH